MFTVMFAIGRLPGWIAQWKEGMDDPKWKLGRPRQIYIGPTKMDYVPIEERKVDNSSRILGIDFLKNLVLMSDRRMLDKN